MEESKLSNCIKELRKPGESRNPIPIIKYLSLLETFMNLIQSQSENLNDVLIKLSKIIQYSPRIKNDLIVQYGDKGDDFYVILHGSIGIFVPKYTEYHMNEQDYILQIFTFRKYNQIELLTQCLKKNRLIFSISYENIDDFITDLHFRKTIGGVFLDDKKILKEADLLYENIIKKENNINNNINIKPENYIKQNDVSDSIKRYFDSTKKIVKIPNYELVAVFQTGDTFGELALEHSNSKRMATIIALSDCDFGIIDKNIYTKLIKDSVSKRKNKFFGLIYTYKIFNGIKRTMFDKKYYNFFRTKIIKKDSLLIQEGKNCDNIYFILSGEYELYVEKNIAEINQLIINLFHLYNNIRTERKNNNEVNNTINENDIINLDLNLKEFIKLNDYEKFFESRGYTSKYYNNMILSKKKVVLGIYKSRQILGLNDIIYRVKNKENKSLINCKCTSKMGELYYISYKKFLEMYIFEDKVKINTNELLMQNLHCFFKTLFSYKKYLFEVVDRREKETINDLKDDNNNILNKNEENKTNSNIYNKSNNFLTNKLIKNRFFSCKKIINNIQKNNFNDINIIANNNTNPNNNNNNKLNSPKVTHYRSKLNLFVSSRKILSKDSLLSKKDENFNIISYVYNMKHNQNYKNGDFINLLINNDISNSYEKKSKIKSPKRIYKQKSKSMVGITEYQSKLSEIQVFEFLDKKKQKLEIPLLTINDKKIYENENIKINDKNNFIKCLYSCSYNDKNGKRKLNPQEIAKVLPYNLSKPNLLYNKSKLKYFFHKNNSIKIKKSNNNINNNVNNNVNNNINIIINDNNKIKNIISKTFYKKNLSYNKSDLNKNSKNLKIYEDSTFSEKNDSKHKKIFSSEGLINNTKLFTGIWKKQKVSIKLLKANGQFNNGIKYHSGNTRNNSIVKLLSI